MGTKRARSKPIPTRFSIDELAVLDELSTRTGLDRAEIVRRCVRLVQAEVAKRGTLGFILDDLDPKQAAAAATNETPKKYGKG